MTNTYTIGRLARAAGVRISTLRFYERRGLLPPPPRRATGYRTAGYRLYGDEDLARLRFIQEAKTLGFSLHEIEEILRLRVGEDAHTCESVREHARSKMGDIDRRLRQLRTFRKALAELIARCESAEPETSCPILDALGPGGLSGEGQARASAGKATHGRLGGLNP